MSKIILSHEGYDKLYQIVSNKAKEYQGRMIVEDYVRMHHRLTKLGKVKPFYGCVAANQEIAIQHDGSVYPCQKLQYAKYHCGNVTENSLTNIWKSNKILNWPVDERQFRKEIKTPIQCFCELAVLPSMRKQGFGKRIIQFMEPNNPTTKFLIHAADVKESSYSHFWFKSLQYSMQANGNLIRCIKLLQFRYSMPPICSDSQFPLPHSLFACLPSIAESRPLS